MDLKFIEKKKQTNNRQTKMSQSRMAHSRNIYIYTQLATMTNSLPVTQAEYWLCLQNAKEN